jgi:hypothetical protein
MFDLFSQQVVIRAKHVGMHLPHWLACCRTAASACDQRHMQTSDVNQNAAMFVLLHHHRSLSVLAALQGLAHWEVMTKSCSRL